MYSYSTGITKSVIKYVIKQVNQVGVRIEGIKITIARLNEKNNNFLNGFSNETGNSRGDYFPSV